MESGKQVILNKSNGRAHRNAPSGREKLPSYNVPSLPNPQREIFESQKRVQDTVQRLLAERRYLRKGRFPQRINGRREENLRKAIDRAMRGDKEGTGRTAEGKPAREKKKRGQWLENETIGRDIRHREIRTVKRRVKQGFYEAQDEHDEDTLPVEGLTSEVPGMTDAELAAEERAYKEMLSEDFSDDSEEEFEARQLAQLAMDSWDDDAPPFGESSAEAWIPIMKQIERHWADSAPPN